MTVSQDLLDAMSIRLKESITELKEFSVESLIAFVEQCQLEIVQTFSLPEIQVRRLDPGIINTLLDTVSLGEGGQFAFRHGEQDVGPTMAVYNEVNKKVIMMQAEHNETDPITISSAIEFMGTLLTLSYLKEKTGCRAQVTASFNCRARQPAETLAKTLDAPFALSPVLACINYPDDARLDRSLLDAKGNLEWDKRKVDAVAGEGAFDRITDGVKEILAEPMDEKTIKIIMTHTQQLDEFYRKASGASSSGRLSNYGFIYRNNTCVLRCDNGFYHKEMLILQCKAPPTVRASSGGLFDRGPTVSDAEPSNLDSISTTYDLKK